MRNVSKVAGMHLTPHDLRRTFTHVGAWLCRIDIQRIELLTNHVPTSVTARHYLETERLEYLKPEVQAIADRIAAAPVAAPTAGSAVGAAAPTNTL